MGVLGALGAIAGSGALGDIIGAGVNYAAQKEAIKWQKEQYYHNLEYNKPINQMARLEEAGINPHMAYSKGTINNIASPVPNLSAPQINTSFVGKLEQLVNLKKMNVDIQNMEETNQNLREQNKRTAAEAKKAAAEARIAEHDARIIENSPFSSRANLLQSASQGLFNYGGALLDWFKHQVNPYDIEPGIPVIRYDKPKYKEYYGERNQSSWPPVRSNVGMR